MYRRMYSGGVYVQEDVPLVEFMYRAFTRIPVKSYRRRLRSLLYLCYVFRALINSLCVCSKKRTHTDEGRRYFGD